MTEPRGQRPAGTRCEVTARRLVSRQIGRGRCPKADDGQHRRLEERGPELLHEIEREGRQVAARLVVEGEARVQPDAEQRADRLLAKQCRRVVDHGVGSVPAPAVPAVEAVRPERVLAEGVEVQPARRTLEAPQDPPVGGGRAPLRQRPDLSVRATQDRFDLGAPGAVAEQHRLVVELCGDDSACHTQTQSRISASRALGE